MPDSALMLDLCRILGINVTDLLNGEVINMDNEKIEQTLLEMTKQKEEADKRLLAIEWVLGIFSTLILMIPIFVAALVPMEDWLRFVLVFSGFIPCIIGFAFCMKIEQVAGYYQCKNCGYRYVPTFKSINMSMHMGRTRFLKCPECHKKTWSKKVITKEK